MNQLKYQDDLMVRMTHHSAAIDNNSLTMEEIVSIVLNQTIPEGKDPKEIYEVIGHFEAIKAMFDKKGPLTTETILDLHYILMNNLDENRGQLKKHENMIVGANFKTAHPDDVPMLIENWLWNLNDRLAKAKDLKEVSLILAIKHIEFERIHPFALGNGKIGRLLINYSLLEYNYPPLVIHKEDKEMYLNYLVKVDPFGFAGMIERECLKEEEIASQFDVKY